MHLVTDKTELGCLCPDNSYIKYHRETAWDQFSSIQSLSHVRLFATPCIAAHQASLSITISRSSLRLMSIESVMPSSHLILCCPLFLLPAVPPSIGISKLIREGWLAVALDLSCIWFACLLYWKYRILAPIPGKSDSIGWYFWLCILQIIGMILMQMARKSTSGNSD